MLTEEQIRQALSPLELPMLGRTLGSLNLVRSVRCSDCRVDLKLAAPAMNELARSRLKV